MIVKSPADFALFIPFGLSSTAAHFLGGRFKLLQASLYISGSGFECETWSPVDNDSKNESKPAFSSCLVTTGPLVEDASAIL